MGTERVSVPDEPAGADTPQTIAHVTTAAGTPWRHHWSSEAHGTTSYIDPNLGHWHDPSVFRNPGDTALETKTSHVS